MERRTIDARDNPSPSSKTIARMDYINCDEFKNYNDTDEIVILYHNNKPNGESNGPPIGYETDFMDLNKKYYIYKSKSICNLIKTSNSLVRKLCKYNAIDIPIDKVEEFKDNVISTYVIRNILYEEKIPVLVNIKENNSTLSTK